MRALWGDHLHHGLWHGWEDDAEAAARRMVIEVGRGLGLKEGSRVIDVGCGYGAAGVLLEQEFGLKVEGVTISPRQVAGAVDGAQVAVGDWLQGFGDDGVADGVIAIESLEHMADRERAVGHLARVLRPGGRVALACWVRVDDPTWLERAGWLDPIRKVGCLWGQGSVGEWEGALERAGFRDLECRDVSDEVAPTWRACLGRGARLLWERPEVFRRLGGWESLRLGLSAVRIVMAYELGLLRYVLVSASR